MRKALITLLLGVALVGSAKPKQKPAVVRLDKKFNSSKESNGQTMSN